MVYEDLQGGAYGILEGFPILGLCLCEVGNNRHSTLKHTHIKYC